MKILVLGSDGQIGAPLTKYLRKLKHEVIEFDVYSNIENDLRKKDVLDSILPTIDFVFFLAFDVGGSVYLNKYQNTYDFINNNVKIMLYTFASLKKHKTKFLFSSTQMSNMTHSPYGILKRLGEKYTEIIGGMVTKFWNVYGYEKDLNKSHVITDFILMARNNNHIHIKTDGEEEREFLYVEDCCECLNILMNEYNNIEKDKYLHITSFESTKISEVAKIISKEFKNCKITKSAYKDNVQLNKRNKANPEILKYWKPKTTIEEGINEIIKIYQQKN